MNDVFAMIGACALVVIAFAFVFACIIAAYGVGGFVFSLFWNWLAPLVYIGAPTLSAKGGFALGVLVCLAQWLMGKHSAKKE